MVKRYGRVAAVDDVSFIVRPGEVLGLLGPNGAGKTTTIRALVGLTRPTSGLLRVNGFDVWRDPLAAKGSFGFIPDRPYLYAKLTARELLRFTGATRRVLNLEHEIERWLEFFNLLDYGNELIETFSHGMKQKLTLITALLPDPPVLIVDEPMVGLDPIASRQTRELLAGSAARGRTVLLTTHSLPVAEAVATRIALMDHGKLVAIGTLDELQEAAKRGSSELDPGGAQVEGARLESAFFSLLRDEQREAALREGEPRSTIRGVA